MLGQRKVDEKSNEITAIPQLLKALGVEGCTITIAAIGCERKIAEEICKQGGNYVLAVKEKQRKLHDPLLILFEQSQLRNFNAMWYRQHQTVDGRHGRVETRHYTILPPMYLHQLKKDWTGLQSVALVESKR